MQTTEPKDNAVFLTNIRSMNAMRIGEEAVVYDVPDIRLLSSLGIRIGKRVKVITRSFAKGPLVVLVNQQSVVVDRKVAERIMIKG